MPAKTLTNMTAEELATELARKQEAEAAQAAAEQAAREERQAAHARRTWDARTETETELQQRGAEAREEFSAAVKAGDLAGAFAAWMTERGARYARESVRNKAAAAGRLIGEDQANYLADVRWYHPDFLSRLEEEADNHARANGYDLADELVPDAPAEVVE